MCWSVVSWDEKWLSGPGPPKSSTLFNQLQLQRISALRFETRLSHLKVTVKYKSEGQEKPTAQGYVHSVRGSEC